MHPNNPETLNSKSPVWCPPFPNKLQEGQWSSGLFDCSDDPSNCFITCCCPCVTMGRIAHVIDRGTTSCMVGGLMYYGLSVVGCGWLYAYTYRSKLRGLFSLPEGPCSDLLVHCCCCVCSLSQEYRELKNRGVDPSIGWQANVDKWNTNGVAVPPTVTPRMDR